MKSRVCTECESVGDINTMLAVACSIAFVFLVCFLAWYLGADAHSAEEKRHMNVVMGSEAEAKMIQAFKDVDKDGGGDISTKELAR